jgi:isopentenyldiphosphate isomerase
MASEELFDLVDENGNLTGEACPRSRVHAEGLYHQAVHTWIWAPHVDEILLQRRALTKDSWAGKLDVSSAGHISSGEEPLPSAIRELHEELGLLLPPNRFEFLFRHLEKLQSVQKGKAFINNEFNYVYLVTASPEEYNAWQSGRLALQESEVSDVEWVKTEVVEREYVKGIGANQQDVFIVPTTNFHESYIRLFNAIRDRHRRKE